MLEMIKKSHTVVEFYNEYINNCEENYKVDYKTYKDITSKFFKYLTEELIENGKPVKIPVNLGTIEIVKSKKWFSAKRFSVDFKLTNELGKVIYHLNEHTDGFKFRCHWSKNNVNATNINKYRFVLTRANKRRLAQIIINKERDYIEI